MEEKEEGGDHPSPTDRLSARINEMGAVAPADAMNAWDKRKSNNLPKAAKRFSSKTIRNLLCGHCSFGNFLAQRGRSPGKMKTPEEPNPPVVQGHGVNGLESG